MRSVAGYTPDSLVEFGAKRLFRCSSYFFTVPKRGLTNQGVVIKIKG
jgi:hypothetical protein